MITDDELVIPEELSNYMQILTTIVSPLKEDMGILIMGENTDADNHAVDALSVIKIYLLGKQGSNYHVESELGAFAFNDLESAYGFLVSLPEMSALELLIMMSHQSTGDEKEENEPLYLQ